MDIVTQHVLEGRMEWEKTLDSAHHHRPAILAADRLHDKQSARAWVRRYTENELIAEYRRRAPVAAKWFSEETDAELAEDFARALHNIHGKDLSRFTSMVMTSYAPPSLSNSRAWGKADGHVICPICRERKQTLRHVLTSCTTSLLQGRYTYRHNMILKVLLDTLRSCGHIRAMYFDLPGNPSEEHPPSWLANFSTLRPDGWILLEDGSEYIIELTSPWEENFDQARERKRAKHEEILRYRQATNVRTSLITFEVGARGKLSDSTLDLSWVFPKDHKHHVRKMRENFALAALQASFRLYTMRQNPTWNPPQAA